ncbi:hypothetical protein EJ04DRAFT_179943 [Polyplosphaeria fusca]|uniref:T6SS Phospholipase effector Tle1-like catalytic domain-containing protein n=1 Tax=Polyplosphaeria fusca TaxID=682080 RepID=A0A9P4R2U0_9PLEO|nr:hypothetical protein EJ04DRAFT_179943 [Polyplosphaeria fusca]
MSVSRPPKRLLVFCDGTWCGRETGTYSNTRILADMVGTVNFINTPDVSPTTVHPIFPQRPHVTAGYQEGVGLNKTFLEYLWDGATASSIAEECVSVYQYIVQHFDDEHEIWLFGFSRGSYTVRCVAGMINNCGIIKTHGLSEREVGVLCKEVYRTYRSPLDVDHPKSQHCRGLKADGKRVWQVPRPVRLMCIGDTVGSLGIPRLNAGIGFDWPEFYDQKISSVVQEVFHAVSLHDRLWIFQPCLAFNGPGEDEVIIHQKWFPGCHYDLGRQMFKFVRLAPSNSIEKHLGQLPGRLAKTIYPNEVFADLVLRWMLQAVQVAEDGAPVLPGAKHRIEEIDANLASPTSSQPAGPTGSGDVYGNVLAYAPGGTAFSSLLKFGSKAAELLNKTIPNLGDNIQDVLGIKTVIRILTATRDRKVPGLHADLYEYKAMESVEVRGLRVEFSAEERGGIKRHNDVGTERYPSQTFESFQLWKRVFGDGM